MVCPYCGNLMKNGFISEDRYPLKWIEDKNDMSLWNNTAFVKGIKISSHNYPDVKTFYCPLCRKFIIDMDDMIYERYIETDD